MYDTKTIHVKEIPLLKRATEFGNATSFWVEYPNGLVDLSRLHHLVSSSLSSSSSSADKAAAGGDNDNDNGPDSQALVEPPVLRKESQLEIGVDGGVGSRAIRVNKAASALVIIDMQNYFLNPEIRDHPKGLECIEPLIKAVPALREHGCKILWVNWGLTEHELTTLPPSLIRSWSRGGTRTALGEPLPNGFGRVLMRGERNAQLYGPLDELYKQGREAGTDFWIHKNRLSALWGYQSSLDLFLQENGITTLFFAGVNTDQCVLGTLVDSYYRGYDVVLLKDATATTSPDSGWENMVYNTGNSYGFVSDTVRVVEGCRSSAST